MEEVSRTYWDILSRQRKHIILIISYYDKLVKQCLVEKKKIQKRKRNGKLNVVH